MSKYITTPSNRIFVKADELKQVTSNYIVRTGETEIVIWSDSTPNGYIISYVSELDANADLRAIKDFLGVKS